MVFPKSKLPVLFNFEDSFHSMRIPYQPEKPHSATSIHKTIATLLSLSPGIKLDAFTKFGTLKYNAALKSRAKDLRYDENLPEVLLWNRLKRSACEADFHRQKPIGNFVVDLFCPELMLAIEIDGKVHEEDEQAIRDQMREDELRSFGIDFLRFSAQDIFQHMDVVVKEIQVYVQKNRIAEKLTQLERGVYNRNRSFFK